MIKHLSLALFGIAAIASASDPNIFVPATSVPKASMVFGFPVAHTNHLIYIGPPVFPEEINPDQPLHGPAAFFFSPGGYSPAQIASAYGVPSGGGTGKAIAIVDAYHYATSLNDFNVFATQYGLPKETSTNATSATNKVFQVVYQGTKAPSADGGWAEEEALDIEWAHALAPKAKIYLVEANSANFSDLMAAVTKAESLTGVKAVSMSWGSGEWSGESSYDSHFLHTGIVCFASAGDTGGVRSWPAESPAVVGVGGTHLVMNGTSFSSESAWSGSGGGPSAFYSRPAFQNLISTVTGTKRGCPDISADADPYTGCAVYDSTRYSGMSGWMIFGGTSLSSPSVAAMYVTAGALGTNSTNELGRIYGAYGSPSFRDITAGTAGSFAAHAGWDFITGVGSPHGVAGF